MIKKINFFTLNSFLFVCCLNCTSQSNNVNSDFIIDFESIFLTDSTLLYSKKDIQNHSFKGEKALSLPKKQNKLQFAINLEPKNIYKVSCWKKGKVKVTSTIKSENHTVKLKENLSYQNKNGWNKIELLINTSWWNTSVNSVVKIENISKDSAFIDEIMVERLPSSKGEFSFTIKNKDIKKLIGYRNNAFHSPYIKSKNKQKVNANLNSEEVEFKLKGDWKVHINTGVWSFKTFGETPITGDLKTVTFQSVKTRNLLKEWTFINLCKAAGIITPSYEIVTVSVNEGTPYVCALEENFSDNFIYRKRGYSAPVLRLYEDFLFPHWIYRRRHEKVIIPEINHSYIYCFDTKKYSKGKFKKEFDNDAAKLKHFIMGDSIMHLIDQEKWAEFLAIQALTKSYHNLTWHNTRWFVNDKDLIEPVAYDGNTQNGKTERWFGGLYGDLNRYLKVGATVAVNFNNKLFMNAEFMKLYKTKLALYSDKVFLKERLSNFSKEMEKSLKKIQVYYDYDYNTDYLFKSADKLKKALKNIDNSNWFGKEHIFNVDFKSGNAPLNKTYAGNLIRGYIRDGKLRIINGVSKQITILNKVNDKTHLIYGNDEITIDYNNDDKWYIRVESDLVKMPILSWTPLK